MTIIQKAKKSFQRRKNRTHRNKSEGNTINLIHAMLRITNNAVGKT